MEKFAGDEIGFVLDNSLINGVLFLLVFKWKWWIGF